MKWLVKRFFKPFAKAMLEHLLGELSEVAILAVKEAAKMETWTNEEKRKRAFEMIKAEAIASGKELKDSAINLAIELAVQLIK
ncbi:MAG: hypothetical protein LASZOEIN_002056 [Candidatus Fervidibacter sp.]